jgi:hypothetical protein
MSLAGLAQVPGGAASAAQRRTIPFDQQFHFQIRGEGKQSSTVTVSIEAAFVTVSIGYGFVPQVSKITYGPAFAGPIAPAALQFGDIINSLAAALGEPQPAFTPKFLAWLKAAKLAIPANPPPAGPQTALALSQGIQINPALTQRLLQVLQDKLGQDTLSADELADLFQVRQPPPERIQFLYALYDSASGRAFQSDELLNIAGLGIADGDRPFRYFATPIVFPPRSTIQLDVTPLSDFRGDLYITLHGYKVLGGVGTPTGHKLGSDARTRRTRRP